MKRNTVVVGLLVVLLVAAGGGLFLALGDDDPFETYCAKVEEQRGPLGEALAGGPETGLIAALPIFRDLAGESPDDLTDEWEVVIDHVEALDGALDAAGADAASYDRTDPPADVSAEDREAIDQAATALGSPVMRQALAGVEQQARDVCGTPLSL